ncbi:nickel-dependent lactate racemase [Candidatus Bathyarchaeota archaeon]|nr:nickel-dependent lactate racemase [Candidatus Bathyarchaeota archaeon]
MVEVWLPYGKTEVCVRVPTQNLLKTLEPNHVDAAKNPRSEIDSSLANPIGTKRLVEIVKPESKVALVLKDSDTSTNQMMVSSLLNELGSAGVKDENVTVILAYDPFRDFPAWQQMPTLGEGLSSRVKIISHNPEKTERTQLGRTSRGTDVFVNKVFAEADVKIVAGVVEPHPFVGYSGGINLVLPGLSSLETVRSSFVFALDSKADRGTVGGNPVYEEAVEAARLARVDFSLNIVRNGGFEVVKAFAGNIEDSFREAVNLADTICRVPVENRADVVFLSPGGFPFDASFFEACRCLDVVLNLCKRGKPAVLVAECIYGLGNADFVAALSKYDNPNVLEKEIKRNFSVGRLMAYRLLSVFQTNKLFLVSVVPDYLLAEVHSVKNLRTANEAYRYASDVAGKNGKVLFVPNGNLTVPLIRTVN